MDIKGVVHALGDRFRSWLAVRGPKAVWKCLSVEWDDTTVRVRVLQGLDAEWNQEFPWIDITRVCFVDGGILLSDIVLLDIRGREKAATVLTEAQGGAEFLTELVKRGLFPPSVFQKAITSSDGGTYCWPPTQV
jgi:hypothetical protein